MPYFIRIFKTMLCGAAERKSPHRKGTVTMAEEFFTYKGFPLVRNKRQIYYGNMSDEFVATIRITSSHTENGVDIADKLKVSLMRTAKNIDPKDMVVKTSDRNSLFEALDVANIWLTRA